ncbi:trafficking protein particle complex subunit 4-like [Pyrus ussuriensis x Pyrus communis]|uniref:Trafficking protein particle complex subunit n=1 Tax=Pyrus ussuriensis x Pyrus communis TaxID=2448454 RepID=A0A5N5H239_9ROSA|nr:trafficking protein particle complex subunit 4-like [Pyrus ussuriensis x Pyrus communis]
MAAIYSLYIINKPGGLIYYNQPNMKVHEFRLFLWKQNYDYGSAGRMDTKDTLRVASLWYSMHAISQQLSPVLGCFGIELLQPDTFDLNCFQSLTGIKFFVVSEPGTPHMEGLLKHIYELYTDYVLKNPFYEMEMPIRCDLFDINLTQAVQKDRVALLAR